MSQTKARSFWEATTTTGTSVAYAIPVNYLFIEHVHLEPWLRASVLTGTFVVLSLIQKYIFRRFFNWIDERFPA